LWGYVCIQHGWSRKDAAVVCRELGFSPEDARSDYDVFFHGTNFPFFLNLTNCNGSEEHLINCSQGSKEVLCSDLGSVAIAYCSGKTVFYSMIDNDTRTFLPRK
jgi:hypothetical protein